MAKKAKKKFRSAEEMSRWYDEHEATAEDSTPVKLKVDKRYDPTLTMRVPATELRRLKTLADARGIPTATMARMLLLERLREEDDPTTLTRRVLVALVDNHRLRGVLREIISKDSPGVLEHARRTLDAARSG